MLCHLTSWWKVNQKACLICHQNRAYCLFQRWLGWPAQITWIKGSQMTVMHPFYWGEAQSQWRNNSWEGTRILHCSKVTSFQVPLLFHWPMCVSAHHVMPAHCLLLEYSVKTLYSNHCKSGQHKQFLTLMWIPSMLTLWWIFGWGGVDQKIFGLSVAASPEKLKRGPLRDHVSISVVWPWRWCTWWKKNICKSWHNLLTTKCNAQQCQNNSTLHHNIGTRKINSRVQDLGITWFSFFNYYNHEH